MPEITCKNCGKSFKASPSYKRKFCSNKCCGEWRGSHSVRTRAIVKCLYCGKGFEVLPHCATKRKFCNHECMGKHKSQKKKIEIAGRDKRNDPRASIRKMTPMPELTPGILKRFWSRVDKSPGQGPDGDCWQWKGKCHKIACDGLEISARRISYAIVNGEIPKGMHIITTCKNRRCVNPDHLTGCDTKIEKITYKQSEEIRKKYETTDIGYRQLGKEYGVSRTTVYFIVNNMQRKKRNPHEL